MNYIIGFFKILWNIGWFVLSLAFLVLFFFRIVEWGLAYKVVQPKAQEVAYELTTFAEANEVIFTDETLKRIMESWKKNGFIKENEDITVRFVQYGNDKRFQVHVTVIADYWDRNVRPSGRSEMQGINWGEPPTETVMGHYPSYDDKEDTKQVAAEMAETEKVTQENATLADSEEQKEEIFLIEKISHESIRAFMSHYVTAGISAIDNNDFSMVQDLLDPKGKAYKESESYIKYMNEKGIRQDLLEMEVTQIDSLHSDGFKVSTTEEYKITDSNQTIKIKRYESQYHLVLLNDGKLALKELLETDLLSSAVVDSAIYDYKGGNTDFYEPEEESTAYPEPSYIYQQACAACHGENFEGGVGPELYSIGSYMDVNEVKDIILYGRGNMPAGMLDEREADAMAAYLIGLQ